LRAAPRLSSPLRASRRSEREAVGHPGEVVDDLVDGVAALDQVVEDRRHDLARALVLRLGLRPR
jgi:hypothetical protein